MSSIADIGQIITLAEAAGYTGNFQTQNPGAPVANLFGMNVIQQILGQTGVQGIRIYYGLLPGSTTPCPVIVGVDVNGNDMIPGLYADRSSVCPPMCSTANPLNGGV
jgi:hypothetical protein